MSGCRSSRTRSFTRNRADGAGGHVDGLDLAGVHARHAHVRAVLQAGDLRELGIDLERVAEQHAPVADEEQADGEQQESPDDERADGG